MSVCDLASASTMKIVLLLLSVTGTFLTTHARCTNSNWVTSFDKEGLSKCDGSRYIKGFIRSDRQNPDRISYIENAVCCDRSSPFSSSGQVVYADWWNSFNVRNHWNVCPNGFFLQGMYRTGGHSVLGNIEEGRCMKPVDHPYRYGHCYNSGSFGTQFDQKGTGQCNTNYFIAGLYHGGCDQLYCLENIKCCKMATKPDVLDSLATVKTMVMDRTLKYLAYLANYLGYGWCSGCRAPYVGEDFRRNGDTWEADKSGRCNGYKSDHRLSMNYADWKFSMKDIRYGQPLITSMQPDTIDSGVITNDSPTPSHRTINRQEQSVRSVTHTTESSWKQSHELGIEITYSPPDATGGVGGSVSYKFGYEKSSTTTDSSQRTQSKTLSVSDSKEFPPYSSTNMSLVITKTRTTLSYTATVISQFSAELRGFLRWGGGRDSPSTNYHHQHRGSGGRPTFNYRFGDASTPFYEALKYQSDTMQRPWQWADMKANFPSAQTVINSLTSERQYEFALKGKFEDVMGKRMDIVWQQIPFRGSGGPAKRELQDVDGVIDMGFHRSIARARPGDPAPVFLPAPEVDLDSSEDEVIVEPVPVRSDV